MQEWLSLRIDGYKRVQAYPVDDRRKWKDSVFMLHDFVYKNL